MPFQYKIKNIRRLILLAVGLILLLSVPTNAALKEMTAYQSIPFVDQKEIPSQVKNGAGGDLSKLKFYRKVTPQGSQPLKPNTEFKPGASYLSNDGVLPNDGYLYIVDEDANLVYKVKSGKVIAKSKDSTSTAIANTKVYEEADGKGGAYIKTEYYNFNGDAIGTSYQHRSAAGTISAATVDQFNKAAAANNSTDTGSLTTPVDEDGNPLVGEGDTAAAIQSNAALAALEKNTDRDPTDPVVLLDSGSSVTTSQALKSVVLAINGYFVDDLKGKSEKPMMVYESGYLSFNVKAYNSLSDKKKDKLLNYAYETINNFGISNVQVRSRFKDFLAEQDTSRSFLKDLLSPNTGEEIKEAENLMKGPNKVVSKVVGVIVTIIFIMLTVSLVLDIAYIGLPIARDISVGISDALSSIGNKTVTNNNLQKPFYISNEAFSSVIDAESGDTPNNIAVLLYLKRRLILIVLIASGSILIATGAIYDIISEAVDIFLGSVGVML